MLMSDYGRQQEDYKHIKSRLVAVNTQILATVSRKHQYCIAKQQDPRKALKTLKRRFELDIRIERRRLTREYARLQEGPHRYKSMDQWLPKWEPLVFECEKLNVSWSSN
ncbi:hypothetical protein BDV23DRAFT_160562 [Aspergillus alliaceus]|uniref:Uncharacterized protein n=1 Tax=Petromyces alliaceus TaxID=209559 RepID=A0A5N7C0W0_PETAA|nr:hypothetical protein BDV23DRAFT_160562 [Aspergillus alliaceus]